MYLLPVSDWDSCKDNVIVSSHPEESISETIMSVSSGELLVFHEGKHVKTTYYSILVLKYEYIISSLFLYTLFNFIIEAGNYKMYMILSKKSLWKFITHHGRYSYSWKKTCPKKKKLFGTCFLLVYTDFHLRRLSRTIFGTLRLSETSLSCDPRICIRSNRNWVWTFIFL